MGPRTAAVAALVLLAGCSGIAAGPPPSVPPVTPAPVPNAGATATPRSTVVPGVAADGTADPGALANAHRAALSGSYTVHGRQTVRYANGTLRSRRVVTLWLAAGHTRYRAAIELDGRAAVSLFGRAPSRAEFFTADGDLVLATFTRDDRTAYAAFPTPVTKTLGTVPSPRYWTQRALPGGQPYRDVQPLFHAFEVHFVGWPVGEAARSYRITSDRLADATVFERAESVSDPGRASLYGVVDGDGLVRRYRLRYTAWLDGRPVSVTRSIRYGDVGNTTVERPPWADRALRPNATARNGSAAPGS